MRIFKNTVSFKRYLQLYFLLAALFIIATVMIYFFSFYYAVNSQMQKSFESLESGMDYRVSQAIKNIDTSAKKASYSTDVQAALFSNDPSEYFHSCLSANDLLNFVMESNPNTTAIYIVSSNGRLLYTNNGYTDMFKKAFQAYHLDQNSVVKKPFFTRIFYNGSWKNATPYFLYVFPVYNTRNGEFSKDNRAVCAILCDMHTLAQQMNIDRSGQSIMAVTYNGNVISSNRAVSQAEKAALGAMKSGRHTLYLNSAKYFTNSINMKASGWQFSFMIPENAVIGSARSFWNICFAILAASIAFFVIGMGRITWMITKPSKQIISDMHEVRKGRKARVREPFLTEFRELAGGINHTLDCIEEANEKEKAFQTKLYQSIIAQKSAELTAYRSQINPHFFFNTLECMRSMAHHFGVTVIEEIVGSLSMMFRYSLYTGNMVELKDELTHARNYMNIMELRFPDRFKLRFAVDADAEHLPTASMCLQPIVENCIAHGFADKKSPCILLIQGFVRRREGQPFLTIRVTDNGCGIPAQRLSLLREELGREPENENPAESTCKKKSIGLHNINQRLRLIFGEQYSISIRSREGCYTSVELHIPAETHTHPQ